MISFIKGELAEMDVNTIIVEAGGIGYELTATKAVLEQLSEEKKWSISQVTEEILREWLAEKRPDLMPKEP